MAPGAPSGVNLEADALPPESMPLGDLPPEHPALDSVTGSSTTRCGITSPAPVYGSRGHFESTLLHLQPKPVQ
jgi:hypothetical protein